MAIRPAKATLTATPPDREATETAKPNLRWHQVGLPLLVTRALGQGLEFAAFVLLARRLGPADFGILSMAFLACRYLGLAADWGASIRGVRDTAVLRAGGSIHALVRRRNRVTAVLVPGYVTVVVLLGRPELSVLALALAARGLNRDWVSLGRQQGARSGLPAVLQGAVMLVGTVVFARSLGSAAAGVAIGYGTGLALSLLLNRLPSEPAGHEPRLDGWLLTAVLADQVTASSDTAVLAMLRSTQEAGIYSAVYRIPNAWVTVIGLTMVSLIPATARVLACDASRLRELRRRALRVGLLAGAAVVVTIPLSYLVTPAVFGQAFAIGRVPLVVLLLATAVTAVAAPLHPIYIALGRDRALGAITVVTAAVNISANLLVVPSFGMTGAATTTLVAQLGLLAAFWRGTATPASGGAS